MSIDVAKPLPTSGTRAASSPSQFETFVDGQLEKTRQQVKLSELFAASIGLTAWFIGFLLLAVIVDSWIYQFGSVTRITSFSILVSGCLFIILRYMAPLFLRRISRLYAAKMIEDASQKFHNSLVNYLQLKSDHDRLKQGVVQAVSQRAARDLSSISPSEKVDRSRPIQFGFVLAGLVLFLVGYAIFSPKSPWPSISRVLNPMSRVAAPSVVQVWKVTPGDAEVFFGQKLLVTAEIRGRHDAESVRLIYSTDDGQHSMVPITMRPTGTANTYQLELATTPGGIDGPLRYSIEAHDGRTSEFHVSVRANPAIAVQKIDIFPPKYTQLPERTLEGKSEIEALEGSAIKIHAVANMPIQVAYVELLNQKTNKDKNVDYDLVKTVEMQLDQKTNAIGSFVLLLNPSRTKPQFTHYQLRFLSTDGNRNQLVNVHPVRILPDLAPEIKIVRPVDRHPRVPVNRALDIEIHAADLDFEISNIQLILDHQGSQLLDEEVDLPNSKNRQRVATSFQLEPRKFQLKPGDQVIFHARASDNRVSAYSSLPEPNVSRSENYTLTIDPPSPDDVAEKLNQQDEPAKDTSTQPADKHNSESTDSGNSNSDAAKDADNAESKAAETESDDSAEKGVESSSSTTGQNSEPEKMTGTPPDQSGDLQDTESQSDPATNQKRDSAESKSKDAKQSDSIDQTDKNRTDDPPKQSEKSDNAENSSDKSDTNQKSDNKQKSERNQGSGKKEPGSSSTPENKQSSKSDKGDANQPDKNSGSENKSPNSKSSDQAGGKSGKSDSDKSEQSKSQPGESSASSESKSTDAKAANDPDKQGPASKKPNSGEKTGNSEKQDGDADDVDIGDPQKEMDKNATDGERMDRLLKMAEQKDRDQQAAKPDNKNQSTNQPGESSNQPDDKSANNKSSNQDKAQPGDQAGKKGGSQPSSNDPNKQSDKQGKSESKNSPSKSAESSENSDNQKKQPGGSDSLSKNQPKQQTSDADKQQPPPGNQTDKTEKQADQKNQPGSQSPQKGNSPQGKQAGDGSPSKEGQPNSPSDGTKDPKGQQLDEKGSQQGNGQAGQPSDKSNDSKNGSSESGQPGGKGASEAGEKGEGKQPSGNSQGADSKPGSQSGQEAGTKGSESGSGQGSGGDSKQGGDISSRGGPGKSPTGTTPTQKNSDDAEVVAEPNPADEAKEAQKATDLVLDYLKDQANKADPDLLNQMNWTEQDLRDFLARWEEMKARAETGDPTQKKRYEDALRSLDLRTETTRKNTLKSRRDKLTNLSEDGTVNRPPAELAEQFNTFMKNRNRETKDK